MPESTGSEALKRSVLTKGFREEVDLLSRHIKMLKFVQKHGPRLAIGNEMMIDEQQMVILILEFSNFETQSS